MQTDTAAPTPRPPVPVPQNTPREAVLRERAGQLEAAFLAEMLGLAGLGSGRDASFGGGIGEEQFASFLRQAQADAIVRAGGIGLAESIFRALTAGEGRGVDG